MQPVCVCVCVRAGDRGVAWLACSIQSVMSAQINVGHSVHALHLLCVFSWFFSTQETRLWTRFCTRRRTYSDAREYDKLGVAARGRISVPLGSIRTFAC